MVRQHGLRTTSHLRNIGQTSRAQATGLHSVASGGRAIGGGHRAGNFVDSLAQNCHAEEAGIVWPLAARHSAIRNFRRLTKTGPGNPLRASGVREA